MSIEKIYHGERIKKIRNELQLSQQDLARKLGIPLHKIKDVEGGKIKVTVEMAVLLEEKFNLDFKWLLTGKGSMRAEDQPSPSAQPAYTNSELLRHIVEVVESGLVRSGATIDPGKKARLIVLLHECSLKTGKPIEADMIDKLLELITS